MDNRNLSLAQLIEERLRESIINGELENSLLVKLHLEYRKDDPILDPLANFNINNDSAMEKMINGVELYEFERV